MNRELDVLALADPCPKRIPGVRVARWLVGSLFLVLAACGGGGGGSPIDAGGGAVESLSEAPGFDPTGTVATDEPIVIPAYPEEFVVPASLEAPSIAAVSVATSLESTLSGRVPWIYQLFTLDGQAYTDLTKSANCGPTSYAMVRGYYSNQSPTADETGPLIKTLIDRVKAENASYHPDGAYGAATSADALAKLARGDGFEAVVWGTKDGSWAVAHGLESLALELQAGHPVIVRVILQHKEGIGGTPFRDPEVMRLPKWYRDALNNPSSPDYRSGHYVVVVGIRETTDGKRYVVVNDPARAQASYRSYEAESIVEGEGFVNVWNEPNRDGIRGSAVVIRKKGSESTAAITVATLDLREASVGAPYSATLGAQGGVPPYVWTRTSGALPSGLALATDGTLSGVPGSTGSFPFRVKVRDQAGKTSAEASVVLVVKTAAAPAIRISSPGTLATGVVGKAYESQLTASGGMPPSTWSLTSGALPAGLALSPAGKIFGVPTQKTDANFIVSVQDSSATTSNDSRSFSLKVLAVNGSPTISSTTASPKAVAVGADVTVACSASDPEGESIYYAWSSDYGSFSTSTSASSATWKAPSSSGAYVIRCSVSDPSGALSLGECTVTVGTATESSPTITGFSPSTVAGANSAQSLTINGTNFVSGCTVTLKDLTNGGTYTKSTTFVSASTVTISANFTNAAATWSAEVVNPSGKKSGASTFTVTETSPKITGFSPGTVPGANAAQTLTINGSNFASGCSVTLKDLTNGGTYTKSTTFVSASTVTISANFTNAAATWSAEVVNPSGKKSGASTFTVTETAPTITSVSPSPVGGSNSAQTLTINGTNFASGCTVTLKDLTYGGTYTKSTTFVSATKVTISANFTNTTATWSVQVVNPSGKASGTTTFGVVKQ